MSQSAPTNRRSDTVASRSASRSRYGARNSLLRRQGYENYAAYLRSAHWLQLRKAYAESDLPQLCFCGEDDVQLHHVTYERVGTERLSDLTPLCRPCHSLVHVLEWRGEIGIDLEGLTDAERAAAGQRWLAAEAERLAADKSARLEAQRAEILASSFAGRLFKAQAVARRRHVNVAHAVHMLQLAAKSGQTDKQMTRKLRILEAKAYGWDDWLEPAKSPRAS